MLINEFPTLVVLIQRLYERILYEPPTLITLIHRFTNEIPTLTTLFQMRVNEFPTPITVLEEYEWVFDAHWSCSEAYK